MAVSRPEIKAGVADLDLSDHTVLVTGSTRGVGKQTALAMGRLGATVFVHGRDRKAGRDVVSKLDQIGASDSEFFAADFSDLHAVRTMAADIANRTNSLDVLINNAGGYFPNAGTTSDGFSYTFCVNHLAPFALTAELWSLVNAADGRIVVTSSAAHRGASLDLDAITSPDGRLGFQVYAQSKLANILFANELNRRSVNTGSSVRANSIHPGAIPGSGFGRHAPFPFSLIPKLVQALPDRVEDRIADTPADGAATVMYAAVSPETSGIGGAYFSDCQRQSPASAATNEQTAVALWERSEELLDQTFSIPEV
ncbi:SDR family NAD(P)-dependent oxidoreductase [Salinarchaeum sp. IM2453]|nr:SDR family NAD(P)-dependent oxidoreductase [Salinarchaeum sp. IM2453]